MAGNEEIRSSLVEGLEDISEEEQLKMALELSKNDLLGPSVGFGASFQPSPTNMSVDSTHSAAEVLEFDKWIRTPVEDRLQLLNGAGDAAGGVHSDNVSESSCEAVKGASANEDTYISDIDDEDEDEILKKIIEQSKHDLLISEEEKTNIALEQSEQDTAYSVPMDSLDENEQLEVAIKMSLGATYERLNAPSVPKRKFPTLPTVISNSTLPIATPPSSISPPLNLSSPFVRPRPRPTSFDPTNSKVSSLAHLPAISPTTQLHSPPPYSPLPLEIQLKPRPTTQSPSIPCPSPVRGKQKLNLATSPMAASPSSPRNRQNSFPQLPGFPPLTEEEQLEMVLKISQEEAEGSKKESNARQKTEKDQIELAMRLSRSESASQVSGNTWQPVRQNRASGGGTIPHQAVRPLAPLAPSHSSPSLPSQFSKKTSLPSHSQASFQSTSQCEAQSTAESHSQGSPRMIVVDGSNVGMAMGANQQFRAQALSIVYAWFSSKGHEVLIILPRSRWNRARGKDRDLLERLEKAQILVFTPSRRTQSGCWDSYDDRYIVKYAAQHKGIIVTNDNYRDLIDENPEFKDQIENRLLPFTFIREEFFPPDDPMGKNGPMLTQFLRH
eukprot:GFUD01040994.1.p1 GENE.GFUD01040994.1~~GFUD01040994.1.p1  ORF type:complete len:639 (+),score=186.52 GFUD01040994.1:85-1917(+)